MGPEDTPQWNHPSNAWKKSREGFCHICRTYIIVWHCNELGCPWCNKCGAKTKENGKK